MVPSFVECAAMLAFGDELLVLPDDKYVWRTPGGRDCLPAAARRDHGGHALKNTMLELLVVRYSSAAQAFSSICPSQSSKRDCRHG